MVDVDMYLGEYSFEHKCHDSHSPNSKERYSTEETDFRESGDTDDTSL